MSALAGLEAYTRTLDVILRVMDFIPEYDQRKKEKLHDMVTELKKELNKSYGLSHDSRDDNKIAHLTEDIDLFIEVFHEEIK